MNVVIIPQSPASMSAHQQPASTPAEPHRVTVDHVKTPSEDIVVVDVREPEELTAPGAMTFPGAVNYPRMFILADGFMSL